MFTRGRIALSVLTVSALALVGCSDSGDSETTTTATTAVESAATSTVVAAEGEDAEWVTFTEAFVKAKPEGKDMTGIFGTFTNSSDADINVVGFTSSLDAPMSELHEVVDGVMQEKEGGFILPAGGEYVLKPGGDHMMLMGYSDPIEAGDTVDIVLEFSDGSTQEVKDLPVRTVASGEENYGADGSLQGHQPGQMHSTEDAEEESVH